MFRGVLTFRSLRPKSTMGLTMGSHKSLAGGTFLRSTVSVTALNVCVHRPHSVTLTSSTSFWPSGFMTMADMAVPGWSRMGNMRCVAVVVTPATPGCAAMSCTSSASCCTSSVSSVGTTIVATGALTMTSVGATMVATGAPTTMSRSGFDKRQPMRLVGERGEKTREEPLLCSSLRFPPRRH